MVLWYRICHPLQKEMVTSSSILAWETPWTEEPAGPQSLGLQETGHDLGPNAPHVCMCVLSHVQLSYIVHGMWGS